MVTITIDSSQLQNLVRELARMQKKIPMAIARGLNEGGDKVRTQVQRALQRQTSLVRYASVTQRVRTIRAFEGSPSYTIVVNGKPTKPPEFKTRVTSGPGGGVTIVMWGRAHKFPRSFQQKYAGGLRMRLGAPRFPVRSFDGPNLAKEAVKDDSAKAFFDTAASAVVPAVEKQLARALG
jgi:hypothetical protein